MSASADVRGELAKEVIGQASDAIHRPQILMHDQPDADPSQDEIGQDGDHLGVPQAKRFLAVADPISGPQRLHDAKLVVAAESKAMLGAEHLLDPVRMLLAADERMARLLRYMNWRAMTAHIVFMRE